MHQAQMRKTPPGERYTRNLGARSAPRKRQILLPPRIRDAPLHMHGRKEKVSRYSHLHSKRAKARVENIKAPTGMDA